MRFKIEGEVINFFLSKREVDRYSGFGELSAENALIDNDMPFKVEDKGKYLISINGKQIELETHTNFNPDKGYVVDVLANGFEFSFSKIHEINKYDLFRELVKQYKSEYDK